MEIRFANRYKWHHTSANCISISIKHTLTPCRAMSQSHASRGVITKSVPDIVCNELVMNVNSECVDDIFGYVPLPYSAHSLTQSFFGTQFNCIQRKHEETESCELSILSTPSRVHIVSNRVDKIGIVKCYVRIVTLRNYLAQM